jgi:hypothetical protein
MHARRIAGSHAPNVSPRVQPSARASPRTLGTEWNVRLRYPIRDQLVLSAGMAYFKAGLVTDMGRSIARRYSLEASGRF